MTAAAERTQGKGDERGRRAHWPSQIPLRGWRDIAMRVWRDINEDRVLLIAGGVTFYLLLALFPAITAFISTYGFFADPATVGRHVAALADILPEGGLAIIEERLESLAGQDSSALSFGFIFGFLFSYWSANNGVKSIFEGLNIAYDEKEKRSFLWLNVIAFCFTIGLALAGLFFVVAVGVLPLVIGFLHLGLFTEWVIELARWLLLLLVVLGGFSLLYRYGPSRKPARWRWISWGSLFATFVWLIASISFSYYLQNFGDYEAVYGSLGAAIGFMMWTWISVIILVVGAEINAEIEHQTAHDTTIGEARPVGARGAVVADTLGESSEELK